MEQSGKHLLSLIDEVLDISRIEAGRQDVRETDFDLVTLVHELGMMFELRCTQKGLGWRLEGEVVEQADLGVRGDEGKLRQVLSNLLSNAVKFTAEGEVVLTVRRDGAATIRFDVQDTGPGLDPQEQRRIFEPFQRGQVGSEQEGAGLGLAIAQRLVELMGGQLAVDSAPDAGARFFFTVPFAPSDRPVTSPVAAVTRIQAGVEVYALVVDDLAENRKVLTALLEDIGCQVAIAGGGAKALVSCAARRPDIVFMDIRMPEMDGVEAAQRIWKQSGRMPIVAVSASAMIHERQRYLQDGFAGFVAKPVEFDRICQCLSDFLHVEFEYAELMEDEPAWSRALLPGDLLAALRKAAEQGEVTRLRSAIDEIESLGETERQLAAHLVALSRDLDLPEIRRVLGALDDLQ